MVSSAVKPARDGAFLDVTLSPGSDDAAFPASFDRWRDRVKARVRSAPEDGKANQELVDLAESFFDADVTIVRGQTQPRKRLWIDLPRDRVVRRLGEAGL